ncbi:MAG: cobalt ECF transporter T component CbiQ [Candidatus Omnitrophica bacterium]|nr:cobalt ECF transporter T component CbiQ [Candidatus Omnitrophota bacterium]MBU1923962.1 cobalt ECF transporter T component CbiQ [Candidatus Omnitrophota bacterium]
MKKNARKRDFIERSLIGILSFLKGSLFAEEHALKSGFMQSLDPRIKILTFAIFIIATLLAKSILLVLSLYLLCLFLACISKINLGFFLKRTWVFIPLFSLFIALPALFSNFTPGEELFSFKFAGLALVITRPGGLTVLLFVLRVATTVSFAVLLSITTRNFELLRVLRIFRIPQAFVMVLGICYRYIYLFIGVIENTYFAIKSRVGTAMRYKRGQQIVGWNIAFLWVRSYQLNEDVYKAMLSRGYSGEPQVLNNFRSGLRDWLWLIFVGVIGICIIRFFH